MVVPIYITAFLHQNKEHSVTQRFTTSSYYPGLSSLASLLSRNFVKLLIIAQKITNS